MLVRSSCDTLYIFNNLMSEIADGYGVGVFEIE